MSHQESTSVVPFSQKVRTESALKKLLGKDSSHEQVQDQNIERTESEHDTQTVISLSHNIGQ